MLQIGVEGALDEEGDQHLRSGGTFIIRIFFQNQIPDAAFQLPDEDARAAPGKKDLQQPGLAGKGAEELQRRLLRILQKGTPPYSSSSSDMSSFLYLDLGLTPDPMAVEYDNADSLAISMETLPDLTAKHIFLIAGYGSQTAEAVEAAKQRYEEIKADPLWQAVPAVQSSSIYEVDSRTWLTHGIIATEMRIDQVLDYLGQ